MASIEIKPTLQLNITKGMKYSPKSTDDELVQGCIAQNRLAQRYLYERYFGLAMSVVMRYTGGHSEALEICNTVFLKIFGSFEKYQSQGHLDGWVARIALNTAIDYVRSMTHYKKIIELTPEYEVNISNDTDNDGLSNLQTEDILRLVQKLPPNSRAVFSLYVIEGYQHPEISEMLKISVGTSKWHLSFARQELKKLLEKSNEAVA